MAIPRGHVRRSIYAALVASIVTGWLLSCASDGEHPHCDSVEVCDGVDNTCDGVIDERARCAGNLSCIDGACKCPGTVCGGACTALDSDAKNCGECGFSCQLTERCIDGLCTCPDGQTLCDRLCFDLQTSSLACGACDKRCLVGQSCVEGTCKCPAGKTLCGTECVTLNETAHCGSCANVCAPPTASCLAGKCICDGIVCGGSCVTDTSKNCGRCGHDCLGSACYAGHCEAVFVSLAGGKAVYVAVAGDELYYSDEDGSIFRITKAISSPTLVRAGVDGSRARRLAADADRVFFESSNGTDVLTVRKDGTGTTTLGTYTFHLNAFLVDATTLYYSDASGIHAVPKGGGSVRDFASGEVPSMTFWSGNIAFATTSGVRELELATGLVAVLTPMGIDVRSVGSDGTTLVWSVYNSTGDELIHRYGGTGGLSGVIPSGAGKKRYLSVDATHVYFSTDEGVFSAPLGTGALDRLATLGAGASDQTADATRIYFVDPLIGRVGEVVK
jgi:hypothetical protein